MTRAAQQMLGASASCQLEVDATLMEASDVPSAAVAESPASVEKQKSAELADAGGVSTLTQAMKSVQRRTTRAAETAPETAGASNRRRFRNFDSFVAGECNSLAVLASKQVASSPGERYNPLFIYGATGTGKTHLLEAIYSEVRRGFPAKNVMYLTSEAFTNYFTAALSGRTVPSFRQKFRNVDVLLVDNIEFLDNKRATQEEFLHTIVQVIEHGGQVVISSDRHPRMLTKQREELTTRFLSGLVCRVDAPDHETRRRLLQSFCTGLKASFHDDALDYLLRRCGKSVRELQGALNQLESHFHLTGKKVSAATARELLGGMEEECRRLVRISDVEKTVCEIFGITVADLRSASRRRTVAVPRSIAMFLSRRLTKTAYREIGQYFGGRDHSTVVAAERRVSELISQGDVLELPTSIKCRTVAELVDELERRLVSLAS
jgi:chromosomal replication initiator protein